jgi:hypothetical protein
MLSPVRVMSIKAVLDGVNVSSEIGLLATLTRGRRERTLINSCPFLSSDLLFYNGCFALLSRSMTIFGKRCGYNVGIFCIGIMVSE